VSKLNVERLFKLRSSGLTWDQIAEKIAGFTPNALRKAFYRHVEPTAEQKGKAKILILDIETAPILAHVWGLFDQNVGLNQIERDWHLLSWSAKWLDSSEILYMDQRGVKNIEDDSKLCKAMWKLIDESDIIITQNGKSFDIKKLNARFMHHGFPPPSSFRQIDTLRLARKHFGFTSNKLQYMTDKFCTKFKKSGHKKFSGFELWKECIAGNIEAWKEMEEYNKLDVLSLEELYKKLQPWDNSVRFSTYSEEDETVCTCGSIEFKKNGFIFSNTGKFQRYKCLECSAEYRDSVNLHSKEKRKKTLR
jgi:DNA polymerase elongation subunit (family B)